MPSGNDKLTNAFTTAGEPQATLQDVLEALESGVNLNSNFSINGHQCPAPQAVIQWSVDEGVVRITAASSRITLTIRENKDSTFWVGSSSRNGFNVTLRERATLDGIKAEVSQFKRLNVDSKAITYCKLPGNKGYVADAATVARNGRVTYSS
jgi:hypothetical protein